MGDALEQPECRMRPSLPDVERKVAIRPGGPRELSRRPLGSFSGYPRSPGLVPMRRAGSMSETETWRLGPPGDVGEGGADVPFSKPIVNVGGRLEWLLDWSRNGADAWMANGMACEMGRKKADDGKAGESF
jgi:hypothetical protein